MKKNIFLNTELNGRIMREKSLPMLSLERGRVVLLKEGKTLKLNQALYEYIDSEDELESAISYLEEEINEKINMTARVAKYFAQSIMATMKQ